MLFVGSENWPPLLSSWLIFSTRHEMKCSRIIRRKWRRLGCTTWERWTASDRNAWMRSGQCMDANKGIGNVFNIHFNEEALRISLKSSAVGSEAELVFFTAGRERTPGGHPFSTNGKPQFAVWQADGADEAGTPAKGESRLRKYQGLLKTWSGQTGCSKQNYSVWNWSLKYCKSQRTKRLCVCVCVYVRKQIWWTERKCLWRNKKKWKSR